MATRDLVRRERDEPRGLARYEQNPFYELRRRMDQLFDDMLSGFPLRSFEDFGGGGQLTAFRPQIDVSETDQEIKVAAELPGMSEDDIQVSLSDNTLTISGEKKEEKEDKERDYYHFERRYGSFRRQIPLSSEVKRDQVQASFKKGVLNIVLPKTAQAQQGARKIPIKTG